MGVFGDSKVNANPLLTGSNIKIDPSLQATLGQIGKGPQNSLQDIFGKVRSQFAADAAGRGVKAPATGSYIDNRLGTTEDLATQHLQNSLESVLGNTAYETAKADRNYQQDYGLAKQVGELNKPSTLEEILSGLGGGAQVGGQFAGLYNASKRPNTSRSQNTDPALSLFDPGSSGYARYS